MRTDNTMVESIRDAVIAQEWDRVGTRLKVVSLERMRVVPGRMRERLLLPNVSSLDISFDPLTDNQYAPGHFMC